MKYYINKLFSKVLDPGTGKAGDPGTPGVSPNVTVGTVESLPPGDSATVTDSGTPPDVVLNFGIPRGLQGDPGTPGTTPNFDFGDDDPNDLIFLTPPDLYIQTTNPHKVWKRVGTSYEDIT